MVARDLMKLGNSFVFVCVSGEGGGGRISFNVLPDP